MFVVTDFLFSFSFSAAKIVFNNLDFEACFVLLEIN